MFFNEADKASNAAVDGGVGIGGGRAIGKGGGGWEYGYAIPDACIGGGIIGGRPGTGVALILGPTPVGIIGALPNAENSEEIALFCNSGGIAEVEGATKEGVFTGVGGTTILPLLKTNTPKSKFSSRFLGI